jgi:hypothetical protein
VRIKGPKRRGLKRAQEKEGSRERGLKAEDGRNTRMRAQDASERARERGLKRKSKRKRKRKRAQDALCT